MFRTKNKTGFRRLLHRTVHLQIQFTGDKTQPMEE